MAKKYVGWEGEVYYGVAGSTAATRIGNSIDITYELDFDEAEVTERGDGSASPIEEVELTVRKVSSLSFGMNNKASDTTLVALLDAAAAGTLVAIRTKHTPAGKGVDADFFVKLKTAMPLKGGQTIEFSFRPSARNRAISLWV